MSCQPACVSSIPALGDYPLRGLRRELLPGPLLQPQISQLGLLGQKLRQGLAPANLLLPEVSPGNAGLHTTGSQQACLEFEAPALPFPRHCRALPACGVTAWLLEQGWRWHCRAGQL